MTVCLLLILCMVHLIVADKTELLALLQKQGGVYQDPSKVVGDLKQTVLITGCNHGFINHLMNFKCFADRLAMKFLVISFDKRAHHHVSQNTTMTSYLMKANVGDWPSKFRDGNFNKITALKKEIVHDILSLGYNVIFSDTDVAMIRDPVPYMMFENVDYAHSLNYMCKYNDVKWDFHKSKVEGNTGFYFVRSNSNTIKLWHDAFLAAPDYPKLDDQAIFWKIIRKSTDPTVLPLDQCRHFNTPKDLASRKAPSGENYLVSCQLDTCMFNSGMISNIYEPEMTYDTLMTNLQKAGNPLMAVHANYLSGNEKKMNHMKKYGFWLSSADSGSDGAGRKECAEYVQQPFNTSAAASR